MRFHFFKKITFISIFILSLGGFIFADSTYTVKHGDTLWSISKKYQITVPELMAANNLTQNDVLKEGAKLVIPAADISTAAALNSKTEASVNSTTKETASNTKANSKTTDTEIYKVQAKETWYGISRKYGISVASLLELNGADSSTTLIAGQSIKVPSKKSSESKSDAVTNISSTVKNTTDQKKPSETSSGVKADGSVIWPLSSPVVKNISGKVSGVLLTGENNESVKCIREGTVMYTGIYRGFGELVFVQSKTGLIYSYSGLSSVGVKKGDYITAGEEIGKTGKGSEAGIKFMVFQNGKPIDPAKAPRG